jgi:hypothetical protein
VIAGREERRGETPVNAARALSAAKGTAGEGLTILPSIVNFSGMLPVY